jgi:hypothetical protein
MGQVQVLQQADPGAHMTQVPKPVRKKAAKKKAGPSISKLKKECDTLWSKIIRAMQPSCLWCGKRAAAHAHHIVPRRVGSTRYAILNGAALCSGCHEKAHSAEGRILFTKHLAKTNPVPYAELLQMSKEPTPYRKIHNYKTIKTILSSSLLTVKLFWMKEES